MDPRHEIPLAAEKPVAPQRRPTCSEASEAALVNPSLKANSTLDSTQRSSSFYLPPSASPTFTLEPYGSGDLRLLKFLPDSRPVWEAPPSRPRGRLGPNCSGLPRGRDSTPANSVQGTASEYQVKSPLSDNAWSASSPQAVQAVSSDSVAEGGEESAFPLSDGQGEARKRGDGCGDASCDGFRRDTETTGFSSRLPEYLHASARTTASRPSSDLLQQAEALCISADRAHQQTLSQVDPWTRNKSVWESAVKERDQAAKWLAGGGMLFDLLLGSANAAPGQRFLKLVEARDEFPEEEAWQKLIIGLQGRRELTTELREQLRSASERMIHQLSGIQGQEAWLELLRMLQELRWVLAKKRYQDVEFAQSDASYPYIAEVYVQLLHLPSRCWGTNVRSVCCSLPLPVPPAFVDHFVLIRTRMQAARGRKRSTGETELAAGPGKDNVNVEEQTGGRRDWGFTVEYDDAAGAFVETRSLIHVGFKPILSAFSSRGTHTTSVPALHFPSPSTCLPVPAGALAEEARPVSRSRYDTLERTARALHRRLQRAQWILLDRCCFQVLAAQAELMRVLGEQPVGRLRGSRETRKRASGGSMTDEATADDERSESTHGVTAECVQVAAAGLKFIFRGVPVRCPRTPGGPRIKSLGTRLGQPGGCATDRGRARAVENTDDVRAEPSSGARSGTVKCFSKCGCHTLDFVVEVTYAPTLDCSNTAKAPQCYPPAVPEAATRATRSGESWKGDGDALRGVGSKDTGDRTAVDGVGKKHDSPTSDFLGDDIFSSGSAGVSVSQRCSTCGCCVVNLPEGIEGLIEHMQGVAVLELRQLFLEAWAYEAFEKPRLLADVGLEPPLRGCAAVQEERERQRGVFLLQRYLGWLATEGLRFDGGCLCRARQPMQGL